MQRAAQMGRRTNRGGRINDQAVRSAQETTATEAVAAVLSRLHASGRLEVEANWGFTDFTRRQAKASARDLENWDMPQARGRRDCPPLHRLLWFRYFFLRWHAPMSKLNRPDHDEIRRLLHAQGQTAKLKAFEAAVSRGDKIQAAKIARDAGIIEQSLPTKK